MQIKFFVVEKLVKNCFAEKNSVLYPNKDDSLKDKWAFFTHIHVAQVSNLVASGKKTML